MVNGEDVDTVFSDAVDDSIVSAQDLSNLFSSQLRNYPSSGTTCPDSGNSRRRSTDLRRRRTKAEAVAGASRAMNARTSRKSSRDCLVQKILVGIFLLKVGHELLVFHYVSRISLRDS